IDIYTLSLHDALPILLFIGTALIGLAIAIGNVLIPGIIEMNFPLKIGLMTGIYAVFMNIFGALGSGLSVPISSIGNLGWRGALRSEEHTSELQSRFDL